MRREGGLGEAEMKGLQDMLRALAGYSVLVMLLGVAMAPAQAQTPVVRFEVERFEVEGDNPLSRARTEEVLAPFTGEHAGVDGLLAAADALERAIEDAGVSFQRVVLPPQSLQAGTVVLRVSVFTVARVEVEGAQHHSEANVRRSVPALREGGDTGHGRDWPRLGGGESTGMEDDESDLSRERDGGGGTGCDAGGAGAPPADGVERARQYRQCLHGADSLVGWGELGQICSTVTTA